jgi:hypothetical protein
MMTCTNCGKPHVVHCSIHLIPCCPGRCAGPARASVPEVAIRMPAPPGGARFLVTLDRDYPVTARRARVVVVPRSDD